MRKWLVSAAVAAAVVLFVSPGEAKAQVGFTIGGLPAYSYVPGTYGSYGTFGTLGYAPYAYSSSYSTGLYPGGLGFGSYPAYGGYYGGYAPYYGYGRSYYGGYGYGYRRGWGGWRGRW